MLPSCDTQDGRVGFRPRRALDDSPKTTRTVRLAIARAKEGDRDAVRLLYVCYSDNVYGYLRSIVRDEPSLPYEQRSVVIMRHLLGLTPTEIAQQMGRTESSIHGLQHRGRRALQRELTQLGSAPSISRQVTPAARQSPAQRCWARAAR